MIDFELTAEQETLREEAKRFTDREVVPVARDNDRAARFDLNLVRRLGEMGYLGGTVSTEYGGGGLSQRSFALIVEEVGRGDSTARTVISVQTSLVCSTLERFGTEEQKRAWLPRLCTGEALGCFSLTEPNVGSDATALEARAERTGGGWRLSGEKRWASMGNHAKIAVVFARTEPGSGYRGVTAFLVPTETKGFSASSIHGKLGLRASDSAALHLDGVELGDDAVLGEVGQGFKIAMAASVAPPPA